MGRSTSSSRSGLMFVPLPICRPSLSHYAFRSLHRSRKPCRNTESRSSMAGQAPLYLQTVQRTPPRITLTILHPFRRGYHPIAPYTIILVGTWYHLLLGRRVRWPRLTFTRPLMRRTDHTVVYHLWTLSQMILGSSMCNVNNHSRHNSHHNSHHRVKRVY